jgi:hypothetical protein
MKFPCAGWLSGSLRGRSPDAAPLRGRPALIQSGFPERRLCHKIPRFQRIHAPTTAAIERDMAVVSAWGLAYLETNHRRDCR